MLNKRFLKFRYTAIRRYGEKKWSAQVETILSEEGEQANIEADQQKSAQLTKMLLHKLN